MFGKRPIVQRAIRPQAIFTPASSAATLTPIPVVTRSRAPIVEQFDDLPKAVRMFGSEKKEKDLLDKIKASLGALIHDDQSVTIICTPEGEERTHSIKAFQMQLSNTFHLLNPSRTVSVAVLAQAYSHYQNHVSQTVTMVQKNDSQIKSFIFEVLQKAIERNVSDIHVEVRHGNKKSAKIRFRADGEMEDYVEYTDMGGVALLSNMAAFLFQGDYADGASRSNAQSSDKVVQHASVRIAEVKNVALRYQTFLDKDGYDLILRVLTYDGKSQGILDLATMGFEPDQVDMLIKAVSAHYGASFLGGSTGSGKTTTMAGVMNADPFKKTRKRLTIEDPVEIELEDCTQCSIQRSANDTSSDPFIQAIKAALRSDPDIAVVGEVRERATAQLMVDMAIAGHNIWGTLHINRMFDALYRLTADSIGIHASVLGSGNMLNLLNAQTLVKTLCPHCKVPAEDAAKRGLIQTFTLEELALFGLERKSLFVANANSSTNKNDCPHCGGRGEKGRTVCAEMVLVDDEMKAHIAKSEFEQVEKVYRKQRKTPFGTANMAGKTFLDHALLKAMRGEICANLVSQLSGNRLTAEFRARKYHGYIND